MASMIKPSHRGMLHHALGVPEGEKIGAGRLMAAKAKAKRAGNGKLRKEVVFAQNFGHKK